MAGKYAARDTDPGPFAYVYRVDTGAFTLLPAVGNSATGIGRSRQSRRCLPHRPLDGPND
ncbi:hypothetical protein ABZ379_12915 [Streptomyces canus]|uniref:hypothetical protein n=1 Tax=Streptomyces canus TaxID=58343 RepID=UPI0033ED568D